MTGALLALVLSWVSAGAAATLLLVVGVVAAIIRPGT